jgi:hypothetical protein
MVVLFFNGVSEGIPCRVYHKHFIFLYGPFLRVSIPPVFNMGNALKECKSDIFSLSKKLWTEKYPSSRFNHLSTTSAYISPSNNLISKFTCTSKGVAWPLDEYSSPMGSHRRICAKLSIILFLFHARDSLSNILIGYPAPSSFFSSPMGFFWVRHDRYCNGLIGSIPNFLYLDLVEDMHEEK